MKEEENKELESLVKKTMAAMLGNKKISELDPVVTPLGSDEHAVVQGGVTLKETNDQISDFVKSDILPSDPNKVLITDASGNVTTDINISYAVATGILSAAAVRAGLVETSLGSYIWNRQNRVSADRALVLTDLGTLLSTNPGFPAKINLPASGDLTLSKDAIFYIWQPDPTEPLSVDWPAGVTVNNIAGPGTITTSGYGSTIKFTRDDANPDAWVSTSLSAGRQDAYNNGPVVQLSENIPSKTYSFEQSAKSMTGAPVSGGTGYLAAGDILTVSGGTVSSAGREAKVRTTTVSAGAVTQALIVDPGLYDVPPANPVATTGGGNDDATFNLNFSSANIITNEESSRFTGGIVAGGTFDPAVGLQEPYISFSAATKGGDGGYMQMGTVNNAMNARIAALSPPNGIYGYNSNTGRVTVFQALVPKDLAYLEDVTLQNSYDNGSGETLMSSAKPLKDVTAPSGKRGRIFPAMTSAEHGTMTTPEAGEIAFCTDTLRLQVHKQVGGPFEIGELAYTSDIPSPPSITSPAYGTMFFKNNTTETVIAAAATPVVVDATYSGGLNGNFIFAANQLIKSTAGGSIYNVRASLSLKITNAVTTVSAFIYKNDLPTADGHISVYVGPSVDSVYTLTVLSTTPLDPSDNIKIYIQDDVSDNNIIVTDLTCVISENTTFVS